MAKKRVTKDPQGSYFKFYRHVIRSKQWKGLSNLSKLAYINILDNFNGYNSKEIICPRDKLVNPMSPRLWLRSTKELEAKGFIIVTRRTGFKHFPNVYELSNRWKGL